MTARDVDHALADLAARQYGAFSRSQALLLGASPGLVHRRLAAGTWLPAADGVYRLRGRAASWEGSLMTACLATGTGAVVSHQAAAALHCLASFPPGPVVVTVRHGTTRVTHLAKIRQSTDLRAEHATVVAGLPVTTLARTIVDLAGVCGRDRLEHALDDAVVRRDLTIG